MKGNFSLFHREKYKDTNALCHLSAFGHQGGVSFNSRQALIVATF
jgi:hypothetical protein